MTPQDATEHYCEEYYLGNASSLLFFLCPHLCHVGAQQRLQRGHVARRGQLPHLRQKVARPPQAPRQLRNLPAVPSACAIWQTIGDTVFGNRLWVSLRGNLKRNRTGRSRWLR